MARTYHRVRGVRMSDRLWAQIKKAAIARHQRPSDFIRCACERALPVQNTEATQ